MYFGNFAPIQGVWNDIFLDIPYVKQASNNLEVSICFNNCEYNSTPFYRNGYLMNESNWKYFLKGDGFV